MVAPKLCENFRSLCTGERGCGVGGRRLCYQGRPLDYILPRFCVQVAGGECRRRCQASIPKEYSCWGRYLPDERRFWSSSAPCLAESAKTL